MWVATLIALDALEEMVAETVAAAEMEVEVMEEAGMEEVEAEMEEVEVEVEAEEAVTEEEEAVTEEEEVVGVKFSVR
ncbi:hypothetical protein A7U60_g5583 [Sanghuangporus baumii]|uniref:Uncharacterized protein n=1 Tax=Sanghuangporus baumii TaxID=108892 RepID=A0A9Q5N7V1_SANBA|nr:hypothetical protein A7U60_g5583 [Sanghuangporus baumii]